jgi:arabinose-5-phosphate isomerase
MMLTIKQKTDLLIDNFARSISNINVDNDFHKAIQTIYECKGKIITTGMGKAGIAMRKFSSTLCSLGTPSCYLHPGEASHGDLGLIDANDILFVASTSGKTREVLEVIDLIRNINSQPIIGLTSHPDSIIRSKANIVLDMGVIKEAGFADINLAPTTSILIMLAITDMIALLVADRKCFSSNSFGRYHHSGYLGAVSRKDDTIY